MTNRAFALLLLILFSFAGQAQQKAKQPVPKAVVKAGGSYNIHVTVTPLKNCWLYLGTYYGQYKNLVDSTMLDKNGFGVFAGKSRLPGGIYFLVSPRKSLLSEFLMDSAQHFSVVSDTLHPENVTITGSPENTLYQQYTGYLAQHGPKIRQLHTTLAAAHTAADSAAIQKQLRTEDEMTTAYRTRVIREHPRSMLALFFNALKPVELPAALQKPPVTHADSVAPYLYTKEHYWDDVNLSDDRLLRTPFFDPKLETYLKYYVAPDADSIIPEINYLLLASRGGPDMYRYLLTHFTDVYINPPVMGQDKVFVFLFNQFYAKGDTVLLTAKQKEYITNRAYSLMANQLGEPAAPLNLIDTAGNAAPLSAVKAPFTFVIFWDPNCSHCQLEVPRVDSIYRAKWEKEGVAVYSVNVAEDTMDAWKKFIRDHHLSGWTHAYQPKKDHEADNAAGRANFRQLYDVYQTPTMYLLDKDKQIIGKKLAIDQFDQLIDAKRRVGMARN